MTTQLLGEVPLASVLIAGAVLVVAALILFRLQRRPAAAGTHQVEARASTAPETLVLLTVAGEALIDAGYDVDEVQADLEEIGRAYGLPDVQVIALPTLLLVSVRTGAELSTGAVSSGRRHLRLHQIQDLSDLVVDARAGRPDPAEAHRRIEEIRLAPPLYSTGARLLGQVLISVGLAVLIGSTASGLVVCAGLGLLVGTLAIVSARVPARFLVLLTVGAAFSVSLPAVDLEPAEPALQTAWPWLAVGVFGLGIVLNQCARPRTIGWILLVLYVAYGAQVMGGLFFGGVLSAFVGAAVMTPVADLIARHRTGPPALVSFTPAFWLLVPGALGLVGVTSLFGGQGDGGSALVTTSATMVSIALGILLGRATSSALLPRRAGSPTVQF